MCIIWRLLAGTDPLVGYIYKFTMINEQGSQLALDGWDRASFLPSLEQVVIKHQV